jgi:transcriptional regulator with XRE-family HTH domain
MNGSSTLRAARARAGLTQARLAHLTGTSQATISAYETGAKQPSLDTFSRLIEATGSRLEVANGGAPVRRPSSTERAETARRLRDVLDLAAALPSRHDPEIGFPGLGSLTRRR